MSDRLNTASFWHDEIRGFIGWTRDGLREAFPAAGVRELWLQGQAFRFFRRHRPDGSLPVYANCHQRNDLVCYASEEDGAGIRMVSEWKLYGQRGFFTKNLTGYADFRPYKEPTSTCDRFVFEPTHRPHPREGSILRDYHKLLGQHDSLQHDLLRLLVLVLMREKEPDGFGSVIDRVDFGSAGHDVVCDEQLLVRVWEVK